MATKALGNTKTRASLTQANCSVSGESGFSDIQSLSAHPPQTSGSSTAVCLAPSPLNQEIDWRAMFGYDFSTQTWDLPLVRLGIFLFNFAADEVRPVLQRLMEVALSALALLVLSPVLICVAIAIKTESKGPVFFKQNRTGKDGQVFQILKLRTMYSGDAKGVEQATQHDARVTKIGRILRKTSFDEIPQFINVLRGDMALVGPRPHAVEHDAYYSGVIPTYTKRFAVRPGLTGWAQINNQRGETDTIEKMAARVRFDLEYIKRPSFVFDLMIIFMTPLVLFSTKNAY